MIRFAKLIQKYLLEVYLKNFHQSGGNYIERGKVVRSNGLNHREKGQSSPRGVAKLAGCRNFLA